MEIQYEYPLDTLPSEHEYNPFRDSMTHSRAKNLKPSITKETTEIIHKSATIKVETFKLKSDQERLCFTTINNNNPKLDVKRILVIEMAHSYDVLFVKVFIVWPSNSQKRMTLTTDEVVLYQLDFDRPDKLKNLLFETWNAAVF